MCFVGGVGCVLKGKYEIPFRKEEDPLLVRRRTLKARGIKERAGKNNRKSL